MKKALIVVAILALLAVTGYLAFTYFSSIAPAVVEEPVAEEVEVTAVVEESAE